MRRREDVTILMDRLRVIYGDRYQPGDTPQLEEDNAGFRLEGVPADFSVLCFGDMPIGRYDVQVESHPPGERVVPNPTDWDGYVYMCEVDLQGLLDLIACYHRPVNEWPLNDWSETT